MDSDVAVLGLGFAEQGNVVLLAETGYDPDKNRVGDEFSGIIGLSTKTGERLFQTRFPVDVVQGRRVFGVRFGSNETQLLLSTGRMVLVYDWKNQKTVHRYEIESKNAIILFPCLEARTLVAYMSGTQGENLAVWLEENRQEPLYIPIQNKFFQFGLSKDGEIAHVLQRNNPHQLTLVDIKRRSKLQELKGIFLEVCWSSDHSTFLAVAYDDKTRTLLAQRYVFKDKEYVVDKSFSVKTLDTTFANVWLSKPYLMVNTYTDTGAWRTKLASLLGNQFRFVVDRLWPVGPVLQLHDPQTGDLLHRIVVPSEWKKSNFFSDPEGKFIASCDWRKIALWDVVPPIQWYPIVCLFAGILFASLLAWKLWQHHPKPTLTTTSSRTAADNGVS